MTKELVNQAQVLVAAASNTINIDFGLVNELTNHIRRIKSQVTVTGTPQEVEAINILLETLPKPKLVSEKTAHMEWPAFNLWIWEVLAKKAPSALLKRQMSRQRDIFMKHANYVQQESFRNAYAVVENL